MTKDFYFGSIWLAYGKDATTLPLTTTALEYKPCLNPKEKSIGPDAVFYPTEHDYLAGGCSESTLLNETYDSRYQNLNLTLNEYDTQELSNVL